MAQKLVVPITFNIYRNGALVRTETIAQDVIKIGRDVKSHLRIEDESVARMHAVIEAKPDDVQIIDLGSGTQVNGQPVNKCSLRTGDRFLVGATEVAVELLPVRDVNAPVAVTAPMANPVAIPAPSFAQGPGGGGAVIAPPSFVVPSPGGLSSPMSVPPGAPGSIPGPVPGLEGEELYQLIKRGDINPNEVEEVGSQAVEVSILWKSSILHVAHLDGSKDFVFTGREASKVPADKVVGASWALGGVGMLVGAAMADPHHLSRNGGLLFGGLGALTALGGSIAGTFMDQKNEAAAENTARFVVGNELLNGASELPVVTNQGGSRFIFLPGATGEVDLQGSRRSLEELKAQGHARPSTVVSGGFEVAIQPEGRYRQEVGGLTIVAKVVAPGRIVAGHLRRDNRLWGAVGGSLLSVGAMVATLHFAIADDSGFLSQGSDDDRLAELRAFIQRQQERQPEQQQQQANDQQEGGTGTRHAGPEGKMGRRDAPVRSARYAIKNNGEPPHLSRAQAREQVQNRGIFAAIGAAGGGMPGGASGIVSPFGGLTESGMDNQNANGNMTGDAIGDAFGYGGLGAAGTGWGGGGTGEGTIGMGSIGTMGHGSGTGTGQGYGSGAGRGLRDRGTRGPTVRAAPPSVTGLLSPDAIRRVVLRNLGQVNHCYEQGLATNPNIAGRVAVRFVIGGTGTVMAANVSDSSIPVPSVGQCVANAVRRWQFPAPEGGGIVTVNYPFNLQPADQ
ncbi:MAG: TonB family protein [Deltaproteobacteria bacterium]|nr:TonB family protein [Deltaproteobacteria bacterium]